MGRKKRQEWSEKVFRQMKERLELEKIKEAYFHTGREYRDYLIPRLKAVGIICIVPLRGLAFGQQLAWYGKHKHRIRYTISTMIRDFSKQYGS